jgi:tetratricopeptide (TPR) repeat protein
MCVAVVQLLLGQIALHEGDHKRARAAFVASLPTVRTSGWRSTAAAILVKLAEVARKEGEYGEATARYAEALAIYRQVGGHLSSYVAWVLSRQAEMALEQGDWAAAQAHLTDSLTVVREMDYEGTPQLTGALLEVTAVATVVPSVLEVAAALAAVQGAADQALRLAGAAAALRARLNRPLALAEQATLERRSQPARQTLSAAEQARAWAVGQAMTTEQAIGDALARLGCMQCTG